jgi:hypothetical protein
MRIQKAVRSLWIGGFFGLVAAAHAQTLSPSAPVTKFDGTYAFVSGMTLNEISTNYNGHIVRCRTSPSAGPLAVANGQAQYTSMRGLQLEGTVGLRGELAMRYVAPVLGGFGEIITLGTIDGGGTVSARQVNYRCTYDLIWRKRSK